MMVETENTPNPDTLKFLPGNKVSEVGPIEFLKKRQEYQYTLSKQNIIFRWNTNGFFWGRFYYCKKRKRFKMVKFETQYNFRD